LILALGLRAVAFGWGVRVARAGTPAPATPTSPPRPPASSGGIGWRGLFGIGVVIDSGKGSTVVVGGGGTPLSAGCDTNQSGGGADAEDAGTAFFEHGDLHLRTRQFELAKRSLNGLIHGLAADLHGVTFRWCHDWFQSLLAGFQQRSVSGGGDDGGGGVAHPTRSWIPGWMR